ncbi:helix-turn-helix domain-containing protein [Hymenobacter psychrophilus]|uniref:Transcriptional regulator, AraC family n=1 Tax=Hymenobacter psychrophilus TaxID=651662 RepID=A0A1H3L281_9BACT|nr:helix-turn-helix transcriptional regulator [Hymenobacter psychrophilus]SDY57995.1 transcriptional regulator, AraC family [Hymenobacter psychrophilus]
MKNKLPRKVNSISAYHQLMGLPRPEHPLISVVRFESITHSAAMTSAPLLNSFYSIALKKNFNGKLKYGQQVYDFDEGMMVFLAPGQLLSIAADETLRHTGWLLLLHPDFLWNTPLAKTIRQYPFFSYAVHEALHLSAREEDLITDLIQHIGQEYHAALDSFSQRVIVAQLELLLTYSERFYQRQFITRKMANHQLLERLEDLLTAHFDGEALVHGRPPTVQAIADQLHVAPNYLSGLLKSLTGQSTQQHIQGKLIEKAKEKLSTADLSVSEIAYALGFEHSQSFSKLFKTRTTLSPLAFRNSFN